MPTQSISFESETFAWIESEAKHNGHTISFMVNFFCSEARQKKIKERPSMLRCIRHPETMYSSKLSKCPLCAEEETLRDIEYQDSVIKNERARLTEAIKTMQIEVDCMANEINKLDPQSEDTAKRDKLNQDFDTKIMEMRNLKLKLSEMI